MAMDGEVQARLRDVHASGGLQDGKEGPGMQRGNEEMEKEHKN